MHPAPRRQDACLQWAAQVSDLICLGSPHQGAPLERAGHGVDVLLGSAPYAAPLARLGKVRSAGITDLRRGSIVEASPNFDETGHLDLLSSARVYERLKAWLA